MEDGLHSVTKSLQRDIRSLAIEIPVSQVEGVNGIFYFGALTCSSLKDLYQEQGPCRLLQSRGEHRDICDGRASRRTLASAHRNPI